MEKIIRRYSRFVSNHPYFVLFIALLITVVCVFGAFKVEMKSMDYEDMLPDDIEVISALDYINDQFGGSDSATIAIEISPEYSGSDEPRDVRNPKVISYVDILSQMVLSVDDVNSVTSASTLLKVLNDDIIPKNYNEIVELTRDNALFDSYISKDYSMSLVRLSLSDDYDEDKIIDDLNFAIESLDAPPGIIVSLAGQTLATPVVKQQLGPDMARTSQMSLIGILIVLFLLFRSIRFGLTPLATIGIGVIWAFGFIGIIGMGMNSATSGVISMIMGIGIDFGIQTVARFRQELESNTPEDSMRRTLNSIFMPMAITTLAALIGFRAMSWGELTLMGEMGTMMSIGIVACFFVAVSVVPAILIIGERLSNRKYRKKEGLKLRKLEKKIISEEKLIVDKLSKRKLNSMNKTKINGGIKK